MLVVKLWACVGIIQTKMEYISLKTKKIWRRIYLIRSYKERKEKWKDSLNIKIHCKICYCKQNGKRWFEWSFFLIKAEVKEKNSSEVCRKVIKCVKSIIIEAKKEWSVVRAILFICPIPLFWPPCAGELASLEWALPKTPCAAAWRTYDFALLPPACQLMVF